MNNKPKFHHLPPLPGRGNEYLRSIDNILDALTQYKLDERPKLVTWLMQTYEVAESSAIAYVQCLAKLKLISLQRSGSVALTISGRSYLAADLQHKCGIVAEIIFERAAGCLELLEVFALNEGALHLRIVMERLQKQFPYWRSRPPYEHRILWLLSLTCVEQVGAREYKITQFGREQLALHAQKPSAPQNLQLGTLIEELNTASTDTEHPSRFEHALARAFRFLGYEVNEVGTSGDTDLIVTALAGSESYTAIIDAKTRADGRLRDLPTYALQEHQQLHKVDYVMVVARDFSEGRVLRQATETGITLITFSTMREWLNLHSETPLNLTRYRSLFEMSGIVEHLPEVVIDAAEAKKELIKLLIQLVVLMYETTAHGLRQPLSSDQWFAMLVTKLHGVHYSGTQVKDALALLAHPLVGAAICDNESYVLAMTQDSLSLNLRELAHQFDL